MLFSEFLIIEKLIEALYLDLNESIFNDLDKIKINHDVSFRIEILSSILFYVKMHQGSAGNTDLKKFYSNIPIEEKIKQIEITIRNHEDDFKTIRKEVRDKFNEKKEYEIYSSIINFFKRPERMPPTFQ